MNVQQDHPHVNKDAQTTLEVMNATVMMDTDWMKTAKLVVVRYNQQSVDLDICVHFDKFEKHLLI